MPQNDTPFLGQPCGDPVGGRSATPGEFGTFHILSTDDFGNLNVNVVGGGGGGSNPAAGPTGSPVPVDASYTGFKDNSGNLVGISASTPLPVTEQPFSSTADAPVDSVVGTSSSTVLAANVLRKGLTLTNISFETISLSFGAFPAVLFSGITLGPGGSYWMDSYEYTTASVNAIATGTSNLSIQETQ